MARGREVWRRRRWGSAGRRSFAHDLFLESVATTTVYTRWPWRVWRALSKGIRGGGNTQPDARRTTTSP